MHVQYFSFQRKYSLRQYLQKSVKTIQSLFNDWKLTPVGVT